MDNTKVIGDKGEEIARKYLEKNSYKILATNFRYSRFGEVDIIGEIGGITVFFEVKYRNNLSYGLPEEAITPDKLAKCKKTIEYYVLGHRLNFEKIRFDVITIMKGKDSYKLKHYRNVEIG